VHVHTQHVRCHCTNVNSPALSNTTWPSALTQQQLLLASTTDQPVHIPTSTAAGAGPCNASSPTHAGPTSFTTPQPGRCSTYQLTPAHSKPPFGCKQRPKAGLPQPCGCIPAPNHQHQRHQLQTHSPPLPHHPPRSRQVHKPHPKSHDRACKQLHQRHDIRMSAAGDLLRTSSLIPRAEHPSVRHDHACSIARHSPIHTCSMAPAAFQHDGASSGAHTCSPGTPPVTPAFRGVTCRAPTAPAWLQAFHTRGQQ
jgi:hypothetical protein